MGLQIAVAPEDRLHMKVLFPEYREVSKLVQCSYIEHANGARVLPPPSGKRPDLYLHSNEGAL